MTGKFIKVKCNDCESIQICFDRSTISVKCQVCGATLLEPKGGKAKIIGKEVGVLD